MRSLGSISDRDQKRRFPYVTWWVGAEDSIFIDENVTIGAGTQLEANIVLRGGTYIDEECIIRFGCEMTNTTCGKRCELGKGQFTRSVLGNFVKAKHSCYIGDTRIEDGVNIGADVTTCNSDGAEKKRTFIGKDSFIGVGVKLVARHPVLYIGRNVYIATGVVVRQDIPDGMFVRPAQVTPEDIVTYPNRMQKRGSIWVRVD